MKFLIPWHPVPEERRAATEAELAREIPANHVLAGRRASAIARRQDMDDVLFELDGGAGWAIVHLTYRSTREEDPRWPSTSLLASFAEFERLMKDDAADFDWEEDEDEDAGKSGKN